MYFNYGYCCLTIIIPHYRWIIPQMEPYTDALLYKTPLGYLIKKSCRISFLSGFYRAYVRIDLTQSDKEYKVS
jgi:hypothetical protein